MEVCYMKKALNLRVVFAVALALLFAVIGSFSAVGISAKAEELQTDEKVIVETLNNYSENAQTPEPEIDESQAIVLPSADASYILSRRTYSSTPASEFKRKPRYGLYNFENVRVGDIIYESTVLDGTGHSAIVSDIAHDSPYGKYIQTIEAVAGGVQYGFLDDDRMIDYGVCVCSPYLYDDTTRGKAIQFCKNQLGKGWWFDTDDTPIDLDGNQQDWYCSELIYAAYYNATGSLMQVGVTESGHVMPGHLYNTWQTSDVVIYSDSNDYISPDYYLQLSVVRNASKWRINVYNPTDFDVEVEYNKKMCFGYDAEDWTNLGDLGSFSLAPRKSTTDPIQVSTNFFATHIAFSWVYETETIAIRYITYANNLSTNGTLSQSYSAIHIK